MDSPQVFYNANNQNMNSTRAYDLITIFMSSCSKHNHRHIGTSRDVNEAALVHGFTQG